MSSSSAATGLSAKQSSNNSSKLIALKARAAILQEFPGDAGLKTVFGSVCGDGNKYADKALFVEFIEDVLASNLTEAEEGDVFSLFDVDGDGKVSLQDFLNFTIGQCSEARKALEQGNGDVVVDLRVSENSMSDFDFAEMGYEQLKPRDIKADVAYQGSFSRGQSIWIWRRSQGTCNGRLRPVIDVQMDSSGETTPYVVSGYSCASVQLAGQWIWIKRASNEEEEKDAIVDFHVTQGQLKNSGDPIWHSPGNGWIRIDGNFSKGFFSFKDSFLWILPLRSRTLEGHLSSPIRSALVLSEEVKRSRLLASVRAVLRNFVPLEFVPKLAKSNLTELNIKLGAKASSANNNLVLYDATTVFHLFDTSRNGQMSQRQFTKLLQDIGIRIESKDMQLCFKHFNINQDGYITREEYCQILALTPYEIDLVVDKLRSRLLLSCATTAEVNEIKAKSASASTAHFHLDTLHAPAKIARGKNKLRENRTLSQIFTIINEDKKDGILSVAEIVDLAGKLDIYINDEEARNIIKMMDIDGDDRVEEKDFINFMKKDSEVIKRKANRIKDAASTFRHWLLRGANIPEMDNTVVIDERTVIITDQQWDKFKVAHESLGGTRFPGYLTAENIVTNLHFLGAKLSLTEVRELLLLISPEKNGKIYREDLQNFMKRSSRSYGELVAVISKTHFKAIFDRYIAYRESIKEDGVADKELEDELQDYIEDMEDTVLQTSITTQVIESNKLSSADGGIVSIVQLKAGIEAFLRGHQSAPSDDKSKSKKGIDAPLNLEEYAALVVLFDSAVAKEDIYGMKITNFIEEACSYVIGNIVDINKNSEVTLLDMCKELAKMIIDEAKAARKNGKIDYHSVFNLFDKDASGTISLSEFQLLLDRLKLLENLNLNDIPMLLKKFDKTNKGFISFDDFVAFVNEFKDPNDGDAADDSDDEDNDINNIENYEEIQGALPPSAVTRNSDCDWLLWFLWKQACKLQKNDPETIIYNLESLCSESDIVHQNGNTTVKELWSILGDMKMIPNLSRIQYEKSIKYLVLDGTGSDLASSEVDYEALCRYVLAMGGLFRSQLEERIANDRKTYLILKKELAFEVAKIGGAQAGNVSKVPKYEKVFRSFDVDGDGQITIREFKQGLKRLHIKSHKNWSRKIVQQLFAEIDTNNDNVASIRELSAFLRDLHEDYEKGIMNEKSRASGGSNSDDFSTYGAANGSGYARKANESALFRKITEVLMENVQTKESLEVRNAEEHLDTIKVYVKKFYEVTKGSAGSLITSERYSYFLRKSGLESSLSDAELQILRGLIARKNPHFPSADGTNEEELIDLSLLIDLLNLPNDSLNLSKLDNLTYKVQEAVRNSNNSGRPFLYVCGLADIHGVGQLTKDDFVRTLKLLGCILNREDTLMLYDIIPAQIIVNGCIDYKKFNDFVSEENGGGKDSRLGSPIKKSNSSNFGLDLTPALGRSTSHVTTSKVYLNNLYDDDTDDLPSDRFSSGRLSSSDRILSGHFQVMRGLGERVKAVIEQKTRKFGVKFNLVRHFEQYVAQDGLRDHGHLQARTFQDALSDLGLHVSGAEWTAIDSVFNHKRGRDSCIDYEQFVNYIDAHVGLFSSIDSSSNNNYNSNRFVTGSVRGSSTMRDRAPTLSDTAPYATAKVVSRFITMQSEGRDLRSTFEAKDPSRSGSVSAAAFRDIICRVGLLQTEIQVSSAIEDFASISNKAQVSYDDFIVYLEKLSNIGSSSSNSNNNRNSSYKGLPAGSTMIDGILTGAYGPGFSDGSGTYVSRIADGNGFDGLNKSVRRGYDNTVDSLGAAFRENRSGNGNRVSYSDDSKGAGGSLLPPKVTDSLQLVKGHNYGAANRYRDISPKDDLLSTTSVRTSYGTSSFKSNKTSWTCDVCKYKDNSLGAKKCSLCDAPNYTESRDFSIQEKCQNCHFVNTTMSGNCEICQVKLVKSLR